MKRLPAVALRLALGTLLAPWAGSAARADLPTPGSPEFFEKKIRPVLADSCYKCHAASAEKLKGGLLVDSRKGLLNGGDSGPAVEPGNPEDSLLVKAMRGVDKDLQMPPKKKLSDEVVADFTAWVKAGAPWPGAKDDDKPEVAEAPSPAQVAGTAAKYQKIRQELWSWQPVKTVAPPVVKHTTAVTSDIDRFVVAKLEEQNLKPSGPADRATLIRRATYDLTGLPPTPQEVEAFVKDSSPEAFARVVDRLLASPRFGERWGRHWLDVARYAESTGMTRNYIYYYAWRYRDYVIKSFNADKPYDRFVTEQLAGDLLPAKTPQEHDELQIATGFLAIGPKDYNEKNRQQFVMNVVDEQIDATTKAFLATTVACARCHDHKFDAIPTADYYAMAGIFKSTVDLPGLDIRGKKQDKYSKESLIKLTGFTAAEMKEAETMEQLKDAKPGQRLKQLLKIRQGMRNPGATAPEHFAMGVRDDSLPRNTPILARGELDKAGDVVPRGFINIPCVADKPAIPTRESGRLQLAQWITSPQNPLTARVMVNRIWGHLIGQGLVRTVDNFGTMGEKPSHPELLDHLAANFARNGWSIKKSIREIMLSGTYQQSSAFDKAKFAVDPDNRMLWRMNQRRLEAESIRDSILAATGKLNTVPPGGSSALSLPPVEIGKKLGNIGDSIIATATYRSVYLPVFRNAVPEVLEAFDMADPDAVDGARDVTTVAPQALFMMNSAFVLTQAKQMVERLANTGAASDAGRVEMAYRFALGRSPTSVERDRALNYINYAVKDARSRSQDLGKAQLEAWGGFCQALFACAEFRYVN